MNAPATALRQTVLDRVLGDFRGAMDSPQSRAAARLAELGWPSARDEHWRYSNLRAFEPLQGFRPPAGGAPEAAAAWAALRAQMALPPAPPGFERLIYLDGVRVEGQHRMQLSDDAAPLLTAHLWPAEQRLGLLCDMFANDAAQLQVRGAAAIEILFISSQRSAGAAAYPRLQLLLEPGSRLTLIERHLGAPDSSSLVACNLKIELARDAMLNHYRLQQYGRHCLFADTLSARLAERSRYTVHCVAVGAGSARTSAHVQLSGRGAAVVWRAIAVGRGEQVHDVALKVDHNAPDTQTDEMFRGIAGERARLAFSGHIQIEASAPGSQAHQSLRGLIDGGTAEIDLRPRLEILTDEVRAAHGATTGRLDEDLLFYLLARGIDRQSARALLKWAFLGDVLREIELPSLRVEAERLAAEQLPDVTGLGDLL